MDTWEPSLYPQTQTMAQIVQPDKKHDVLKPGFLLPRTCVQAGGTCFSLMNKKVVSPLQLCTNNAARQVSLFAHKYVYVHTHQAKCPSYLSFLLNLCVITPESCSLPPQLDFDSSSSWRCKSEILPHAIVYVLENWVSKIIISWCYALECICLKVTNSDHLQQDYVMTILEYKYGNLATGISLKITTWWSWMETRNSREASLAACQQPLLIITFSS